MLKKSFLEYVQLREADQNKDESVNSKISLGDGNNLEPFYVSNEPNSEHYGKNKNLDFQLNYEKGSAFFFNLDEKITQS